MTGNYDNKNCRNAQNMVTSLIQIFEKLTNLVIEKSNGLIVADNSGEYRIHKLSARWTHETVGKFHNEGEMIPFVDALVDEIASLSKTTPVKLIEIMTAAFIVDPNTFLPVLTFMAKISK